MKALPIDKNFQEIFGIEKDIYKKYNEMMIALMTNIYTISKLNKNEIVISNFNRKSEISKCVLIASNFVASSNNWNIKIKLPLFQYLLTKHQFKDLTLKRYNKKDIVKEVNVDKEISHLNEAFKTTNEDWAELYYSFYFKGE